MEVIISDIEKANAILAEYKGAKVELWSFDRFHEKIELLIDFVDNENVVFITLISCKYFKGGLYWLDSELRISKQEGSDDGWGTAKFSDLKTGFYIEFSEEFVLKKGTDKEFFKEFPPDGASEIPPDGASEIP